MEIKLDLKDRKILAELDFNARQPISKIAKNVNISKEVALYRIRKLESTGIIKQYYAIINASKLGYYYCRLLIKFQSINKEIEERIIAYLKENPKIAYLGILDGSWDLVVGCWVKDLKEFEDFIDEFVFDYGRYILEKEISVGIHLWQFPYRFLLNQRKFQEFKTGGKIETFKLDEIDKKILLMLTKNARIGYEHLGKELNLSGKAISNRIKNLIKKGIIVGFRTLIDYKKFNYTNSKVLLCLQNLTRKEYANLINYLKSISNCIYITKPIGKPDLEFEVLTQTREEFFKIIRQLRENFSNVIRAYDSFIIYEEPISRFIPLSTKT